MNIATFTLIAELLTLVANTVPKIAPGIKALFDMMKGIPVEDITQAELEARVDAAVAKLPVWV